MADAEMLEIADDPETGYREATEHVPLRRPGRPRRWPPRWPSWPRRRPHTSPPPRSRWTAAPAWSTWACWRSPQPGATLTLVEVTVLGYQVARQPAVTMVVVSSHRYRGPAPWLAAATFTMTRSWARRRAARGTRGDAAERALAVLVGALDARTGRSEDGWRAASADRSHAGGGPRAGAPPGRARWRRSVRAADAWCARTASWAYRKGHERRGRCRVDHLLAHHPAAAALGGVGGWGFRAAAVAAPSWL